MNCDEEGEHTLCLEIAPAGTYINCVEDGEHTVCLEVAPAGTYINFDLFCTSQCQHLLKTFKSRSHCNIVFAVKFS
jgi:hypothetical protein